MTALNRSGHLTAYRVAAAVVLVTLAIGVLELQGLVALPGALAHVLGLVFLTSAIFVTVLEANKWIPSHFDDVDGEEAEDDPEPDDQCTLS